MKSLIDYYDDYAQNWANNWYNNETLLPYLKEFLAYLPKKPKVLDLCCGAGYESMRLKNLGATVVGADLSEESVRIAKEKNPNIKFYLKDMLKSYADLGIFDGVACIAGIIHLDESKVELAFKNMHEVIAKNGFAFIVVKDGDDVTKSIEIDGKEYAREFYCYTLEKLKQYSKNYFKFVKEIPSKDKWRYYIFKKI